MKKYKKSRFIHLIVALFLLHMNSPKSCFLVVIIKTRQEALKKSNADIRQFWYTRINICMVNLKIDAFLVKYENQIYFLYESYVV